MSLKSDASRRFLERVEYRGDQQPDQELKPEFGYFGRSRSRSRSYNCIKNRTKRPKPESYYCSVSFKLNFEQNSSQGTANYLCLRLGPKGNRLGE